MITVGRTTGSSFLDSRKKKEKKKNNLEKKWGNLGEKIAISKVARAILISAPIALSWINCATQSNSRSNDHLWSRSALPSCGLLFLSKDVDPQRQQTPSLTLVTFGAIVLFGLVFFGATWWSSVSAAAQYDQYQTELHSYKINEYPRVQIKIFVVRKWINNRQMHQADSLKPSLHQATSSNSFPQCTHSMF